VAEGFPELFDVRAFGRMIDTGFNQIVMDYGQTLEAIFLPVLKLLLAMEKILQWLPWWVVLLVLAGLAYGASRRLSIAVAVAGMTFCIGLIGVWEAAMATIALMVVATLLAVIVGLPIGVAMSRSNRMQAVTLPVLDVMQTMPIFVYLIPFVMLFGPGKIPALLATIVFAIPPVIRLTNLGIRGVDAEIVEATRAFGASTAQILFTVQIPLALPTILAGINQTTMMALSMVVIASMIGAGGLGYQVLQGIQRLQISNGLMAGLGIVLLAIIFDRIAQSYGKRMQNSLKLDH
jgi:glycine betaine/proline transport system permease protein